MSEPTAVAAQATDDSEAQVPSRDELQLRVIREQNAVVSETARNLTDTQEREKEAKAAVKAAQSRYDGQVRELRRLITEGPGLFDQAAAAGQDDQSAAPDESWRGVELDELTKHGLSPNIVRQIKGSMEFETIGQLADWTNQDHAVSMIPGIGESKAQAIEDALYKFWDANPQYCRGSSETSEPVQPPPPNLSMWKGQLSNALAAVDHLSGDVPDALDNIDSQSIADPDYRPTDDELAWLNQLHEGLFTGEPAAAE